MLYCLTQVECTCRKRGSRKGVTCAHYNLCVLCSWTIVVSVIWKIMLSEMHCFFTVHLTVWSIGLTLAPEVALHQGPQPVQQSVHEHLQGLLSQQGLHHLTKDLTKDATKDAMKDVKKVTIDCHHLSLHRLLLNQCSFKTHLIENCPLNNFLKFLVIANLPHLLEIFSCVWAWMSEPNTE